MTLLHALHTWGGRCAIGALAAGSLLGLSGPAQAASHTLWQGGTAELSNGTTYTASFDTLLLFDPARERLVQAAVSLDFVGQSLAMPRSVTTIITDTILAGYPLPRLVTTTDTISNYADALDSVQVMLAHQHGQTAQADDSVQGYTARQLKSSTPVSYTVFEPNDCLPKPACQISTVYFGDNRVFEEVSGYQGPFRFTAALNADAMATLGSTGLLRYGFTVTSGGVRLQAATLTLVTQVPEPAPGALLPAGLLAGLLVRSWRRPLARPGSRSGTPA